MRVEMRAVEAAERIRAGALTSQELVTACLGGIGQTDDTLRAWVEVDRDTALGEAKEMDALRQRGLPLGALHGVPVALDERFGASDVPAVVERLKEAGAMIAGRTRVTGPGSGAEGAAVNPHDAMYSAGDPCGGAAAAVGAGHVPLAVACESEGGILRSASYCGVFGFRPTRGTLSRRGACVSSPTLDQIGVLGRDLEDVAFLADLLGGYDARDAASYPRPRPRMREGLRSTPPVGPDFIRLDMPWDDRLSAAGAAGFEELREGLGEHVARLPAPAWFGRLPAAHQVIDEYETATRRRARGERGDAAGSERAARGLAHGEERYRAARLTMERAQAYFSGLFNDYDALVAPATAGEAPRLGAGTDDPVFCRFVALCGLPALCVPLLEGEAGLPVGVLLVGSARGDDRLLRSARWLVERIRDEAESPEPLP